MNDLRSQLTVLLACLMALSSPHATTAQCQRWESGPLGVQNEGVPGIVECQTLWTSGGVQRLVVGGSFNSHGVNLMAWDGALWDEVGNYFEQPNGK